MAAEQIPLGSAAKRYVAAHVLTKLGDRAADAKTVLTAVVQSAGAPTWVSGLLVPIRESGSMLLQPLLRPLLRRYGGARVWRTGAGLQALSVALMALVLWFVQGQLAGLLLLALVAAFALARSLCSLAGKQVLAQVAERGQRGKLGGRASSVSGGLVLFFAGVALATPYTLNPQILALLLLAGACCWIIALWLFPSPNQGVQGIDSEQVDEHRNQGEGFARSLRLLRDDGRLRRFIYSRGLLLSSSLSGPYFLLLDRRDHALSAAQLAGYVLAGALASLLSASLWGRWADRSAKRVMTAAGALAALVVLTASAFSLGWFPAMKFEYLYPLLFLWLSLAHEGVRQGRKTYVVDIADCDDQRADYVATSNAGIGLLLLLAGGGTALVAEYSVASTLALLGAISLLGSWASLWLPEIGAGKPG